MLQQISQVMSTLSPAEARVADWVLTHPKAASTATLAAVAAHSDASEPTVIRFCRRVGLRGFRELGLRLTESLSRPTNYVHRNVGPNDSASDAVLKVMDASIQSLMDMRAQLSAMPFEETAQVMSTARQIAFAGLGASGHVATDACHKFFRLGVPCTAITDLSVILQFAAIAEDDDVLLLLSHTGRWPELAQAAELAAARGATVIAMTNPDSGLAGKADLLFPCQVIEDTSIYTPMSSRLAQLALLDAVHVALALAIGDKAAERLRVSKAALKSA